MGEVLPEREGSDELVVDGMEDGVGQQIEEQAGGDHRRARLRQWRDRQAPRGRLKELGDGTTVVHDASCCVMALGALCLPRQGVKLTGVCYSNQA